MKVSKLDIELSQKDLFIFQLRIIFPEISYKSLVLMWYLYKYPDDYLTQISNDKVYRNTGTASTMVERLLRENNEFLYTEKVPSKKGKGERVMKRIIPEILERISIDDDFWFNWTLRLKKE
jgi:hypothetical protein